MRKLPETNPSKPETPSGEPGLASDQKVERLKASLPSNGSHADLIDAICVDLIERKRNPVEPWDRELTALDYLAFTKELSDDDSLLDVIDADLCVCEELGLSPSVDLYLDSLPNLRSQILELARMCNIAWIPEPIDLPLKTSVSLDFIQPNEPQDGIQTDLPSLNCDSKDPNIQAALCLIPAPDWFEPKQCVSAKFQEWLIRGRDTNNDRPMAMKIMSIPTDVLASSSDVSSVTKRLIDQCEEASKVSHPAWVGPCLATVHKRHIGVVRSWHFGAPVPDHWFDTDKIDASLAWRSTDWFGVESELQSIRARLLNAASILDALATAHQIGVFHGSVRRENLIALHDGSWKLLDAGLNARAVGWVSTSADYREKIDLIDTIQWISGNLSIYPSRYLQRGIGMIWQWFHRKPSETLERVSDWLNSLADRGPSMMPSDVSDGPKRFFNRFR